MNHPIGKMRAQHVLTLPGCSAALGFALALGACSSRPSEDAGRTKAQAIEANTGGVGAESAVSRPSPSLAKRSTPAGLAMATLALFKDDELDHSQAQKLAKLRAGVFDAQRSVGTQVMALRDASRSGAADVRDLESLGSAMAEKQGQIVDHALAGALELSATLSPAQRLAFVARAKESAGSARRLAAKLTADGVDGARSDHQVALAQHRADIFEELAKPVPDQDKVRTLGSALVATHAHASGAAILVPTRATGAPEAL